MPTPQKRSSPLLSGLARGLTADVMGGPVDLATLIANLGIAGVGYAGNKLGLIPDNKLPALIEKPIGGSDWFAGENTPLSDDGSARYMAGRLAGNFAPLAVGLAAKAPSPHQGQTNGLLGFMGKSDPDPDLFLSHGADSGDLVSKGNLVRELYSPSYAVTRNKLSTFKGADSVIVPWPENLDPKLAKTLLTATDSYNPRWSSMKGRRVDNLPANVDLKKGLADYRVDEFVNQRLYERFGTPFPHGGVKQEGSKAPRGALPALGQGLASQSWQRTRPMSNSEDVFSQRIAESPHFQSLEHFVNSPFGGRLVGDRTGHSRLGEISSQTSTLLEPLRVLDADIRQMGAVPVEILKGLASNTFPTDLRVVGKTPRGDLRSGLSVRDPETKIERTLTDDEFAYAQKTAQGLLRQLKSAPTDYAELKAYGPWQVNQATTAGIISRADNPELAAAARARGLPYERVYSDSDSVSVANTMLSRRGKPTISISTGLARLDKTSLPTTIAKKPSLNSGLAGPSPSSILSQAEKDMLLPKPAGVSPAGLENMIEMAKGNLAWNEPATNTWHFAQNFQKHFPDLTPDQAKLLQNISFWQYLKKVYTDPAIGALWDQDIAGATKKLLGK